MDIHDFKTRLERTEKRIQCAAFSEKNKKIISVLKKQWRGYLLFSGVEQMPFYVYAATTERKNPLEFQGYLYKFVRVGKRKFFGLPKKKYGISRKWRLIFNLKENELFKW